MKKYVIIYETDKTVNNRFEIEAIDTQSAWEAFYWEVELEVNVECKRIQEL